MKKSKRLTAALLASAMILSNNVAFQTVAAAPENAGESMAEQAVTAALDGIGQELYAPDLNSLDEFELYTGPTAGTWGAADGAARIDGGNGNKAIAKDQEFTNFVYEADVTVEKQADMGDKSSCQGGLIFRASNGQNGVSDGYYGYYFCLDAKNQKVTLGRSSGNNWYEIASKNMKLTFGKYYHVMVAAYGNHITCYVDYDGTNYAKLDVIDSTHTSGSIGMRNWLSHVSYRNLKVSEYTETTLEDDKSYTNPLLNMCADPDILYYNGTYYLYPTNAGDANDDQGIKVYTSTDLVHWTEKGFAFKKGDGWGTANFWAPDTIERDGVFYMYYVANEQICVATSDSPLGPFKQDVKEPMHTNVKEIDAHAFYDEASGKYYLYFVRFTAGNVIWGAELNDDMKSIKEDTVTEIVKADQGWDQDMGNVDEGPFVITKDGKYYMTYSGSHFQSSKYGSGYAVADSPLGPYTKYENNPIMQSNTLAHGTGHHCITTSPDGTELFMVYHCHHDLSNTEPRQLCIDRMQFTTNEDGTTVLEVKGPTVTPQALPSGASDVNNFIEFVKEDLSTITVKAGTPVEELGLPEQAAIHTSKGDTDTVYYADVTWDTSAYENAGDAESVVIRGTAVLPEGVENLGNVSLDPEITVVIDRKGSEDILKEALDKVEIKNADDIRENISLPEEMDGVQLKWESNNEAVVSTEVQPNEDYYDTPAGVVTRQAEDTKVTLTVTASYEDQTAEKEIEVTVRKKTEAEKEYVGYLYAHFKEFKGVKGEQDIFYGISKDGLNWTALNNNEAVLKSTVGDKATRDPYIIRSAEGDKFYLIATDQDIYQYGDNNIRWDLLNTQGSTALTIWESTDLIHWTNERNVDVAGCLNAGNAWAPEAIYDEATGEYLVYWSSTVQADGNAREYSWVSRTRDFYSFTEPELFNGLSISNIDTSVYKEGGKYYKLVKLEDGANTHVILQSAQEHPLAYGDQVTQVTIGNQVYNNLGGHYTQIDNSASGCLESFRGGYEGATMFKFNDRDEWCVMVDEYEGQTRGYIPFTTSSLDEPNSVKALADNEYTMQDGGKHGVVIPVTQEEYDALIAEYGVADGTLASMEEQEEPVLTYDFENADAGDTLVEPAGKETGIQAFLKKLLGSSDENADLAMQLFGNASVKYDEEKDSNVLYLDGTDGSYGELPQGLFDNMGELTIHMDVKPETTDFNHVDLGIGQDTDKYLFLRFRDSDITTGVSVRSFQNEKNITAESGGYLNRWVSVDIVVKDHTLSFYVDNKRIGTQKVRNITELGANLKAYLGKSFYTDPYSKGSYDNIRIYNRALTAEELKAEYPLVQKLEAENAVLTGLAKKVKRDDASGGAKVGTIDNMASTVTFTLDAPKTGTYRIEIAADGDPNAFPNCSHRYWVNGNESEAKTVHYSPTGWDQWKLYPIEVELQEGRNTFTISHSGIDRSFAELDYITYYTAYPDLAVTVGGENLDAFDMGISSYEVDVEDLENLPNVEVSLGEMAGDSFKAEVVQATKERPEAYITITAPGDDSFVKEYTIRFYGQDTFENPLINFGADPYVTFQDGYYYYVRVAPGDRSIWVTKAAELSRIGKVEPKMVYAPSGDEPNAELWAPEIHFLDGKWYIYYTAGAGSQHRMYVLESDTDDAQGTYTFKGKMAPNTDKWAIDQTVFEHEGQLYAVWSGWDGDVNVDQRIYIARMDNPWTISGERVELSLPEYVWEKRGGTPTINEGPEIVKSPDGVVNLTYSASGSWSDDYCLGCLTLKEGADPMEKASWIKADQPIFEKNSSTTFSTGHACFVKSPDGTEDYIVYHATKNSGDGWNGRGVRTQRVYWNEDGTPYIGSATEYNSKVNVPSGTVKGDYVRYEAEDAVLLGSASIAETYNSSNGKKVTGLQSAADGAEFIVDAEKAGTYKMYIGAATGAANAALAVKVNDGEAVDKAIPSFNASGANRICTDNWFGYEVEVTLSKGENTITISRSAADGAQAADLDYIEIGELLKAAEELAIVTQPEDYKGVVEEIGEFTVEATGEGLTYQWQYCNANSSIWRTSSMAGNQEKTIYVPIANFRNGQKYRCIVTDASGNTVISEKAVLIVGAAETAPTIITQPVSAEKYKGEIAEFTVEAAGEGLTYQWQYCNAGSNVWRTSSMEGCQGPTVKVASASYRDGQKYRCIVTGADGRFVISDVAVLTMKVQ